MFSPVYVSTIEKIQVPVQHTARGFIVICRIERQEPPGSSRLEMETWDRNLFYNDDKMPVGYQRSSRETLGSLV